MGAIGIESPQPRCNFIHNYLHPDWIEPKVRVFQSVAMSLVLLVTLLRQALNGLDDFLRVQQPRVGLSSELPHHGRQLLLAMVLALRHRLETFEKFFDLCESILRGDLSVLYLVNNVAQRLKQLYFFLMGGREADGVYAITEFDHRRGVPGGVLQQFL